MALEFPIPNGTDLETLTNPAGEHSQSVVVRLSANGTALTQLTAGEKNAAGSISVVQASDDVFAVSATALPLPSGAATEATLDAINTKLPAIGTQSSAASVSVVQASDDIFAVTGSVTVSGSVSVSGSVTVSSSALPTGAASETTLAAINTKLPAQGQALMAASVPVVIASNQSAVPVSASSLPLPTGAATESTLSAASAKLPASLGAKTGTASLSVVPATDGVFVVNNRDGSGNALTSATRGSERALSVQVVDASGNQVTSFGGGGGGGTSGVLGAVLLAETGGNVSIPATPAAYSDGDVIGALITFSSFAANNGEGAVLQSLVINEEFDQTTAYNGTSVTCASGTPGVFTLNSHTLVIGNAVRLGGTAVPGGFVAGTTYYVATVPSANTFTLAATPGGSAIAASSTGTSVTLTEVPAQLAVDLVLFDTTLTPASDNAAFAPTRTEMATCLGTLRLQGYTVFGLQATGNYDAIGRLVKCATGSTSLFAVLVNRTANVALSTNARLRIELGGLRVA